MGQCAPKVINQIAKVLKSTEEEIIYPNMSCFIPFIPHNYLFMKLTITVTGRSYIKQGLLVSFTICQSITSHSLAYY